MLPPPPPRRSTVAGVAGALLCLLALLGPAREADALPGFLHEALGPPQAESPLLHHPADGVRVAIKSDRFSVVRGAASVSLASEGTGYAEWNHFENGVARTTPFGAETVVVDGDKAEQYLTVTERQGPATWRWRITADGLEPRLTPTGGVELLRDNERSGLRILPARIYGPSGRDVTPSGVRWSLTGTEGARWLELRLDDANLPLPYVIDPAVDYPSPLYLSSATSTVTGSWQLRGTSDLLGNSATRTSLCRNCVGYVQWRPGVDNGLAATPSSTPTGNGWIVDASGATGFPAGNWSFTVKTQIPDLLLAPGAATLAVGVWKGTVAGGAFTPTQTLLPPTDDPAAQDLRTSVLPVTTTVTHPLPQFSLAAGETLYVEYWRKQVTGINDANLTRRYLDFVVNDGVARIVHPLADETPPTTPTQTISESSPDSFANGSTLYYRAGGGSGGPTFTVAASTSDGESGLEKVTFPGLSGGMTPTTSTDDTTSPYSQTYSWSFGATESGSKTVTARDNAGNTSSGTFTIVRDAAGPTGHSVTLSGGPVFTTPSVPLVLSSGSDNGGSGVDPTFGSLSRDSAPLVGGACGSFSGVWFGVALSDGADNSVTPGNCYRYRYSVRDNVGNSSGSSTPSADAIVVNSGVGFHSASSGGTVGTSLTLNRPANAVVNDLLLAQVTIRSTSIAITPPAGWTFVRRDGTGSGANQLGQAVYYKFVGGSEPASYAWSFGASIDASGGIVSQAGVSPTNPIDVSGGLGGSGTSVTAPSVTTTASADGLVAFFGSGGSTAFTPPAGMTERYQAGGGQTAVSAADGSQAAAGATGTRTATAPSAASSSPNIGQLVALRKDATPPTAPALALSESSSAAFASGTTLYYRPDADGSFTLGASATDGGSGLQAIVMPGLTAGFSPSIDAAATTRAYSWTSGASDAGAKTVTAYDNAGNTATSTFTLAPDSAPPSGGSVTYADGPDADGVITVTTADGTDAGAGVDGASGALERQLAPFTDGSCGVFGGWVAVTSPDTVPPGNCARYRYRVSDNVGNEVVYSSPNVAKVTGDATPPSAPVLTLTESEPDEHVAGTTLYYNPSATNTGTFTVDATAGDAESGIARVDFPEIFGLDASSDTATPYRATYSWTSAATASGAKTVSAVNGSGLSAASVLTVTPDTAAPTVFLSEPGPAALIRDGQTIAASASDALAGVAEVEFAYCAGAVCGWLLATPIGTDSTPPYSVSWNGQPTDGTYTVLARASDHVGNAADSAGVTVIVDNTAPDGSLSVAEGARPDLQHYNAAASVLYYNPVASADFRLVEAASDATAGVQRVDFPAITSEGFSGAATSDVLSPYESGVYGFDPSNSAAPEMAAVVITDAAGNANVDTISFVRDTDPPAGGSVSYADGFDADGTVDIVTNNGADGDAGVDPGSGALERQTATLADGTCGAFGSWSAISSPDTVPDGSCARYRHRVSDRVGNEAVYTSSDVAKVDLSAPADPLLTVTESEPDEHVVGSTLYYSPSGSNEGAFTVEATSSDPESALKEVTFPVLFGDDSATDAVAPYSHSYSWTSAASADTDVTVSAENGAGLRATSSFMVRRDTAGPDVSILAPADAVAIRNGQTLAAAAFDALAGTDAVEFRYCSGALCAWATGTPLGSDSTAPFELAWNLQPPDGEYTLLARARDNVGNVTEAQAVTVLVDNTAPLAAQNDPGTPLEGSVTLEATASDATAGLASATFEVSPGGAEAWTTIGSDSTSPFSVVWDTLTVNDGRYDLRVIATDRAGNAAVSAIVRNRQVTNHPPIVSITSPDGFYVTGGDPDPFTLEATSPSPNLRHVEFFRCSDASVSCSTGAWILLGLDDTAPFAASWPLDPDGNRALRAVVTNLAWSQGTDVTNILIDRTAPSGGSIAYADGYDADGSVDLSTDAGQDSGSGLDTSSGLTERQTAPLLSGECGVFGAWTGAPLDPDTVPDATCARYRFRASDEAGNEAVYTSAAVVRVDLTPPAATVLTISESEPDEHADGTTLYYNPSGANSGMFTVSATASDAESGIVAADFPIVFGGDGSADAESPYEAVYTWTSVAAASGTHDVSVVNGAGLTASASFAVTTDTTAPTGGSVSYPAGYDGDGAISVTTTDGDDALSGVRTGAGALERRTSALVDGACDPFADTWTAVTSPDAVSSGTCAQYRYRIFDNVGNEAVYSSLGVVKVDLDEPETLIASAPPSPSDSADATFSFAASELSSSFECELDGGGFEPCASPQSYTALAEGSHTFLVRATDLAGNLDATPGAYTWIVEITDVTAPDITITAKPGDPSNDSAPSFEFSANEAVAGLECALDAASYAPCTSPQGYSALADGSHTFSVRGTDLAGNVGSATHEWTLDSVQPFATLADPGSPLAGTVLLETTASDGLSGVTTVTFEISTAGADDWSALAVDLAAPYSTSWDTLAGSDGRYDLRAIVADAAGNTAASAIVRNRQVANHPPIVAITSPDGFYLSSQTPDPFTIEATSPETDLVQVEFFRCSDDSHGCETGAWASLGADATAPYTADWAVDADGNRALKAVATNAAGSEGTDVNNVHIDRTPPSGGSISYTDGYDGDGSVVLTTAQGTDSGSGVDASSGVTERQTAPLVNGACGPFGAWTGAPLNPNAVPDGSCARYRYSVLDEAGNRVTYGSGAVVMVDLTAPPAPALELDEDEADQHADGITLFYNPSTPNSGSFTVRTTASDPESGVEAVEFPLVFGADDGSDVSEPFEAIYSWSSGSASAGEYEVTVRNGAGLSAQASFLLSPDTEAPAISLTAPVASARIREGQRLAATAADALAGPGEVEFRYCPGTSCEWALATSIGSVTAPPYELDWTGQPADGEYTIAARVVDNVGNESSIETRTVAIDNTAPGVSISEPGTYVNGDSPDPVGITATSPDPVAAIEIFRCNDTSAGCASGSWVSLGSSLTAPLSVSSSEADGQRAFRAVARDETGNSSAATIDVTIDRTPPQGPELTPSHVPGASSADNTVDVTFASVTDGVSGLDGFSYHWDADPTSVPDTVMDLEETALGVTSPTLEDGTWYIHVRSADRAGNWSATVHAGPFLIDTSPPVSASSIPSFGALKTIQLARTFVVSWSAAGAVAYDVRYRAAGTKGTFGAHLTWLEATGAPSAAFGGSPGSTYCLSSRGRDDAGTASDWSPETCTVVPLNNTSLSHSGSWAKKTGSGYYLGSYSLASQRGASLIRTGVGARRIAFVATKCPACGTVGIYWNKTLLKKVSLAAAITRKKQLIQLPLFASLRQGTVKLAVLSSGKPVRIEGLATSPQ